MKYIVTIQRTSKTFDNYNEAMAYFRKTWKKGLMWSIVKIDDKGVEFAY